MAKSIDLDSPSRYFFKVFFPDQSANQLRIPPAFWKYIEAESGRKISLKGPSGSIWKISLVNNSNEIFLQDGWKEFVSDQSLANGDFLVFQYNGSSGFSVLVFDKTACEKEKAFTARRSGEECLGMGRSEVLTKQENVEEETLIFPSKMKFRGSKRGADDLLPSKEPLRKNKRRPQSDSDGPKLKRSNSSSSSKRANVSLDSETEKPQSSSSGASRSGLKQMTGGRLQYTEITRKAKSKFQNNEIATPGSEPNKKNTTKKPRKACKLISSKDNISALRIGSLISQRRPVTEEEVNRTLQNALSFRSNNPFVLSVMQDTYVYSSFCMSLPVWFVSKHLPKKNTKMTLWDPNGRKWKITYISYVNRGVLSAGWGKFSYVNNLEKYDVCIFELIKKTHLQVHIFRVVDEIIPLLCSIVKK